MATGRALQLPACSTLTAGQGGRAASAERLRHRHRLKIRPMVPRGLPLIGRAGGKCVVQSRGGARAPGWSVAAEASGWPEPPALRSSDAVGASPLHPPGGFRPEARHGFPQLAGRWREEGGEGQEYPGGGAVQVGAAAAFPPPPRAGEAPWLPGVKRLLRRAAERGTARCLTGNIAAGERAVTPQRRSSLRFTTPARGRSCVRCGAAGGGSRPCRRLPQH